MIKFLVIVFLVVFVIPSMISSLWSYFAQKKEAKNPKNKIRNKPLTHAQMMALLEPDGIPAKHEEAVEAEPAPRIMPQAAPHRVEEQAAVKSEPHEVQTIVLRREIYY